MKRNLLIASLFSGLYILGLVVATSWLWLPYPNVTLSIRTPNREPLLITMPLKDKENMDFFFREALFYDGMAYTLFGPKPISFSGYQIPFRSKKWKDVLTGLVPHNLRMKHGWETWQKYQHFFNQNKFLLWEESSSCDIGVIGILIADREKLNIMIQNHHNDFSKILGTPDMSGEKILAVTRNRSLLGDVLLNNELLIDIVLGYGKSNAEMFCESVQSNFSEPKPLFWGDEEYIEHVYSLMRLHDKSQPIANIITYPMFMGDSSTEEGQKLKQEFLEAQKKIAAFYEGKDFLEATLSLFVLPD